MLARVFARGMRAKPLLSSSGTICRTFAAAPASTGGSAEQKRTPVRVRPQRREFVWPPEDLPPWRRTTMKIVSQWVGLIFFGFFMFLAWLSKYWAQSQMDAIDIEMSKPRRHRQLEEREL